MCTRTHSPDQVMSSFLDKKEDLCLRSVNECLAKATTRISFWGNREVVIANRSYDLEKIARATDLTFFRIQWTMNSCSSACPSTQDLINQGNSLLAKVKDFYKATDEQIKNVNCLTWVILWLRSLFSEDALLLRTDLENRDLLANKA